MQIRANGMSNHLKGSGGGGGTRNYSLIVIGFLGDKIKIINFDMQLELLIEFVLRVIKN